MRTVIIVTRPILAFRAIVLHAADHAGPDDQLVCAVLDTEAVLEGSLPPLESGGPDRRVLLPEYVELTPKVFTAAFRPSSGGAVPISAIHTLDALRHAHRVIYAFDTGYDPFCHAFLRVEDWIVSNNAHSLRETRSTALLREGMAAGNPAAWREETAALFADPLYKQVQGRQALLDLSDPSMLGLCIIQNLRLRFLAQVERAARVARLRNFPSAAFTVAALSPQGPGYLFPHNAGQVVFTGHFKDLEYADDAFLRRRLVELGLTTQAPRFQPMGVTRAGWEFIKRTGFPEIRSACARNDWAANPGDAVQETERFLDRVCPLPPDRFHPFEFFRSRVVDPLSRRWRTAAVRAGQGIPAGGGHP